MEDQASEPLVYAVILNWNSYKETLELVEQLKSITYTNLRILVVDNHSTKDGSAEHLNNTAPDSFELICNHDNLGYAGGNNVGINASIDRGANFVWILNPDIRINENMLNFMVSTITSSDNIAAVGSRICFRNDPQLIYTDGGIVYPERGYQVMHLHNQQRLPLREEQEIYEVDYANGSSMLLNVKTVKALGTLREEFFLYFEEAEWCLRAKKHNWRILVNTRAVAYHSPSQKGVNYHYYMSRNRIWLAKLMGKHKRAALKLELQRTTTYFRRMILGTILHRSKILFAKFRGITHGLFRTIK
ncbi:glycosyltransferase family 2 protein [Catalinimonas sp. 4WD22]|uniref:glycosyltransferase family 2 protein n=1 Tax=Catalinimonas locisalis TaxID=3133978 RepID=UPI003101856F